MRTDLLEGKKAVLFDLDGTLVDSMWIWGAIDIEFLGRYGHACPPDLEKAVAGMSFSDTARYFKERFQLPLSLKEIKACWTEMAVGKYRKEVPLKPGAGEFLEYCRQNGIATGIATSNGREIVDAVIEALRLGPYLNEVATACEVAAGKPEPDIYLEVARRLKVDPEACLVFEDIPEGILAGKRAGMTVIAMADRFSEDMEKEKRDLADGFISDYRELLSR